MAALESVDGYEERLVVFYSHYEPSKIKDIPKILRKYSGNEDGLFRALVKKYGPEPEPPAPAAEEEEEEDEEEEEEEEEEDGDGGASGGGGGIRIAETYEEAMARMLKARLTAFYFHYDKTKVPQVDTFLAKYAGKEEALFRALVQKYGPEPNLEDEEEEGTSRQGADGPDGENEEEEEEDEGGLHPPTVAPGRGGDGEAADEAIEMDGSFRRVLYCSICGLPPDYCEFGPDVEKCRPWLEQHAPWALLGDALVEDMADMELGDKKKKKSKRGGQGRKKALVDESKQRVTVSRSSRGGKKVVTHLVGLEFFPGLKLKETAKTLGKRFACSTSVKDTPTGEKDIQIQGDVLYDIKDVLGQLCGISADKIALNEDSGKKKKREPKAPPPQPGAAGSSAPAARFDEDGED